MTDNSKYQWLETGDKFYAALLTAISAARESIRLETYIFAAGKPGDDIRDALITAVRRGVKTMVLIDDFGSYELPSNYWTVFIAAGGEYRKFNPLGFYRAAFRDHRKLLVCDSAIAFVGGFNITGEESGDGITHGWRDLGFRINTSLAVDLAASFDRMFKMAAFRHRRLPRFRLPGLPLRKPVSHPAASVLTNNPGGFASPIKNALLNDLKSALKIRIISGYFLPTLRLRRVLRKSARRGGDIRIITAGKTDVPLARYAGRALYERFLRARIAVFEYEAQILHSKLIIADNVVYIGSANLDTRSLNINYELLVRIDDPVLADQARNIFKNYLPHCREISRKTWRTERSLWEKVLEQVSNFILARIDTYFASRQLSKLR